jgi:hypothetical protein
MPRHGGTGDGVLGIGREAGVAHLQQNGVPGALGGSLRLRLPYDGPPKEVSG